MVCLSYGQFMQKAFATEFCYDVSIPLLDFPCDSLYHVADKIQIIEIYLLVWKVFEIGRAHV